MPKRNDIKNILIIGSGPIIIGQACEFDYSGTQACIAIREEGYKTILINSNPASIMTDQDIADVTYIEPISVDVVKTIIQNENIDAILTTVGGQIALNLACELDQGNYLENFGIQLIGADKKIIERAENRKLFQELLKEINIQTPLGIEVNNLDEAYDALLSIPFPIIIRTSFTLGGKGAVIVNDENEFEATVRKGLQLSPNGNILIEKSILGWKEYELELIRDKNDNCIVICSIENIDPVGVHTGDSISVAPALTLTDKEYQMMRDQAFSIIRAVGVETGGANVQFAVNPDDGQMVVIEMNPRVSRSSALASKATGYPIARIAAKLAVGYTLDEISNELTGNISAAFEPSIDYVVTKIPRFDFEKFEGVADHLHISMQSLGEVMGIGRSFSESFKKAIRSLDKEFEGFDSTYSQRHNLDELKKNIRSPNSQRFIYIAEAYRRGVETKELNMLSGWDQWFLEQIKVMVNQEKKMQMDGLPTTFHDWAMIKSAGFSDRRIAQLTGSSLNNVQKIRYELNLYPSCFKVDSCAAQFQVETNYLYLTYQKCLDSEYETCKPSEQKKIIILGSGPNCIGQGIEFDYCCVHGARAIKALGYKAVMVNCNPETVSTDHNVSDKLYFSALTEEDINEIIRQEQKDGILTGIIIQFGGQTALKCASFLAQGQIPLIGTNYHSIEIAEDREKFREILKNLSVDQPFNMLATDQTSLKRCVERIGFPIILRPSYVIGGKGMEIIFDLNDLLNSRIYNNIDSFKHVLVEQFLEEAKEIEIDALSDGNDVCIVGLVEHFEKAGIHSGDSFFSFPSFSLSKEQIDDMIEKTTLISKFLNVKGLINIQFALFSEKIYVLEVNLRASRTIPFLSKATEVPISQLAVKIALGFTINELKLPKKLEAKNYYFKQPIFSFSAFRCVKYNLGPEMKSTGEQMFIGKTFEEAFKKLMLSMKSNERNSVLIYGNGHTLDMAKQIFNLFSNLGINVFLQFEEIKIENLGIPIDVVIKSFLNHPDRFFLAIDLTLKCFRHLLKHYDEFYRLILIDNPSIIEKIIHFKNQTLQVDVKSIQEWNKPMFELPQHPFEETSLSSNFQ